MRQSQRFINAIARSQRPHTEMNFKRSDIVKLMGAGITTGSIWRMDMHFSHWTLYGPVYSIRHMISPYGPGHHPYERQFEVMPENIVRW